MDDTYSESSRNIYVQEENNRWTEWHIYRSKKRTQDIFRFSHILKWMEDNNLPRDIVPKKIIKILNQIKDSWVKREYKGINEIIFKTMYGFMDPRIGKKYPSDKKTKPIKFVSTGKFIVYKGKLAQVTQQYGTTLKVTTNRKPYQYKEVPIKDARKPIKLEKIPEEYQDKIYGRYDLDS